MEAGTLITFWITHTFFLASSSNSWLQQCYTSQSCLHMAPSWTLAGILFSRHTLHICGPSYLGIVLYCVPPCDSCYIPMTSNGSLFLSFFPAPVVDGDPTKPKRTSEGNLKKWTDRSLHAWWKDTQHIWWLSKLQCLICLCFNYYYYLLLLLFFAIHNIAQSNQYSYWEYS